MHLETTRDGRVTVGPLGTFSTADANALSRMLLHCGMLAAQLENQRRRGEPVLAPPALKPYRRSGEYMRSRYRPSEARLRNVLAQIPGGVVCRPGEVHIAGLVLTFRECYALMDAVEDLAQEARRQARARSA